MHLDDILGRPGLQETRWSIRVRRAGSGELLAEHEPERRLRTASVGKLILLVEVAARLEDGTLSPRTPLSRGARVEDSGLWQHLTTDELPVADAATLVGSVSDNLATNALLDAVGLDAVAARGRRLGLVDSVLHDYVRTTRRPDQPWTLSEGTAREWCDLMLGLHTADIAPPAVCSRVLGWLCTCMDHSMVAGALHLDPLSHGVDPGSRLRLWSKTGTDDGVRADVGVIVDGDAALAYAVLCAWEAVVDVAEVLTAMRDIGTECRAFLRAC